jgi:hypothetical protein
MTKPRFHSRVAKRVWMAFIALAGQEVRTTDLIRRAWPRKSKWHPEEYRRVRDAAAELADPICRSSGQGRPWLWRLRDSLDRLPSPTPFWSDFGPSAYQALTGIGCSRHLSRLCRHFLALGHMTWRGAWPGLAPFSSGSGRAGLGALEYSVPGASCVSWPMEISGLQRPFASRPRGLPRGLRGCWERKRPHDRGANRVRRPAERISTDRR